MMLILGVLLVLWLGTAIVGMVIEGLFWLAVVAIVLFVATAAYALLERRTGQKVR
jgi:hypothetical protein